MRKNIVKKTLAAAMLTLIACTSMSAMAEPAWVRVDDYYVEFGCGYGELWGDAVICGALVACEKNFRHSSYQDMYWTGDITINNSYSKACIIEGYYMNLLFIPRCKVGTYSHDRPDGCYEFKEFDPCEGKGVRHYPDGNSKKDYAGMICDENLEVTQTCAWTGHIEDDYPDAVDILKDCMLAHEDEHMTAKDELQCDNPNGRADWDPRWGVDRHQDRECDGYIVELTCIDGKMRDNACGSNTNCINDLKSRRHNILNDIMAGKSGIPGTIGVCNMYEGLDATYYGGVNQRYTDQKSQ